MTFHKWDGEHVEFSSLLGKTFVKIHKTDDEIKFYVKGDHYFLMYHDQDCCESVYIEDICGDLDDLIDTEILHAEESSKSDPDQGDEIGEWTFYKLGTTKGWVDIRWYGSSNGYYSVGVSLTEFDGDKIRAKKGYS